MVLSGTCTQAATDLSGLFENKEMTIADCKIIVNGVCVEFVNYQRIPPIISWFVIFNSSWVLRA